MIPCSGPPAPAQGVDPGLDAGVVLQRGGVVGLDPGVDHEGAGASPVLVDGGGPDAVDVGRRVRPGERDPEEVAERPGGELGSRRRSRSAGSAASGPRRVEPATEPRGLVVARRRSGGGPRRPGRPAGRPGGRGSPRAGRSPAGISAGSSRTLRPGGGDHELRALVQAVARVVEGVDRRAGLEVEVLGQSTRSRTWRRTAAASWMSRPGSSSRGDDEEVLGQRHLPLAEDRVGLGQKLLRTLLRRVRDVTLAADASRSGWTPAASTAWTAVDAGQDGRDERAGQLVDQLAERVVSSCGGRPTEVNGQIAPGRW